MTAKKVASGGFACVVADVTKGVSLALALQRLHPVKLPPQGFDSKVLK